MCVTISINNPWPEYSLNECPLYLRTILIQIDLIEWTQYDQSLFVTFALIFVNRSWNTLGIWHIYCNTICFVLNKNVNFNFNVSNVIEAIEETEMS